MIRRHVRCDCNLRVSGMCPYEYTSAQEQNSWENRSVLFLRWKGGLAPIYLGPVDMQFSQYSDGLRAGRPGFASQQGKISLFFTPSIQALWLTQFPILWVSDHFLRKKNFAFTFRQVLKLSNSQLNTPVINNPFMDLKSQIKESLICMWNFIFFLDLLTHSLLHETW
jgi:hypothetical protein